MKKFQFIFILVIICLITLTGCGKESNKESTKKNVNNKKEQVTIGKETFQLKNEANLYDLHYKENYVDFHTDRMGNNKIMNYTKGEEVIFEVRIMYDESRSLEELKAIIETQANKKEEEKEINGIKYTYYEYETEESLSVHHYIHVHKGKPYTIAFFLGKNPGNIEKVFMNNVFFEE
ncbi:MAG: hypothetical protein IKE70_04400 [Bacilli bacterium]|nr:hypothetical protein [Bacilli bacterium]